MRLLGYVCAHGVCFFCCTFHLDFSVLVSVLCSSSLLNSLYYPDCPSLHHTKVAWNPCVKAFSSHLASLWTYGPCRKLWLLKRNDYSCPLFPGKFLLALSHTAMFLMDLFPTLFLGPLWFHN